MRASSNRKQDKYNMNNISEKQEYYFCCIPKKKNKPLAKKNYANICYNPDYHLTLSQKEQDIFDLYLLKIYGDNLK